ncbi:DUF1572 domain-containing protein [Ureibacillus sinduriensis]|uniref:DUF1572 domain-containing protein n=1 Tax=Ureibacillus sinduriensis BLB-1 = JCM 15800 TaxID=1384057 RepID=A0A0A3I165_9BACL|nr:DUF1572 domain-containing protein [Ureibacillus sinduriensis]KGR76373.1 hypothetical protein CD33_07480 [Ureibacillus sinduriensis BLB-1 = JCM 15800]
MSIDHVYLKVVQERFKSVKELGDKTINQLSEEEIHWSYNKESNSVAVIVKHMGGNMISRWTDFLTSDGEKPDRNRDEEFENTIASKQNMIEIWEKGWGTLFAALRNLGEQDLLRTITIRSESHTVIDAIERQMAHYAYHVGQIVYIGKQVKDKHWKTLSIPKGYSQKYLENMQKKHKQ